MCSLMRWCFSRGLWGGQSGVFLWPLSQALCFHSLATSISLRAKHPAILCLVRRKEKGGGKLLMVSEGFGY